MRHRWILLVLIGFLFVSPFNTARAQDEAYFELMKVLVDSFEQIERNYVTEVDRRELVEAALKGMMEKLDPYSNFIGPDELQKFNQVVDQEFGGIGIQVSVDPRTRRLTVMTPLPGTPAYRAGVRAGDQIIEIDGKSTEGFTLDDAVKALKGKPGEAVQIGIIHANTSELLRISVTREIIHVSTVLGDTYQSDGKWNYYVDPEKKIAYIRISSFSRDTVRELTDALNSLKESGMKGLVLDLRFNPGGLLQAAIEVSDLFVEEGKIVSTKGRNTEERVWNARKPGTFSGFPMAVLVNRYSASASEIVSACLQDHKRAVIVGERTWGKGSVQNVIELEGGKSAIKLTTASYHRPSGVNIHRFPNSKDTDTWGVVPDEGYKVDFSLDEMQQYLEYRRTRDVISDTGPPKSDYVDKQLAKAVAFVVEKMAEAEKPAAGSKPAADGKTSRARPASSGEVSTGAAAPRTGREPIESWIRLPLRRMQAA